MGVWNTRPLQPGDDCGYLDSGRRDIDDWLAQHAMRLQIDGGCATHVLVDQPPYVHGFYSLVPHRLVEAADAHISGHAGGSLSGFLVAKLGLHTSLVGESSSVPSSEADETPGVEAPNPVLLILDALVEATRASRRVGGKYLFIDTTGEPAHFLRALDLIGFKSVTPAPSPVHFIKLKR